MCGVSLEILAFSGQVPMVQELYSQPAVLLALLMQAQVERK